MEISFHRQAKPPAPPTWQTIDPARWGRRFRLPFQRPHSMVGPKTVNKHPNPSGFKNGTRLRGIILLSFRHGGIVISSSFSESKTILNGGGKLRSRQSRESQ